MSTTNYLDWSATCQPVGVAASRTMFTASTTTCKVVIWSCETRDDQSDQSSAKLRTPCASNLNNHGFAGSSHFVLQWFCAKLQPTEAVALAKIKRTFTAHRNTTDKNESSKYWIKLVNVLDQEWSFFGGRSTRQSTDTHTLAHAHSHSIVRQTKRANTERDTNAQSEL